MCSDALRASLLVQRIDVLGAEKEAVAERALEVGQSTMSGIGSDGGMAFPALGIELPDHFRVGMEGLRGGDVLDAVAAPQSVGAAEGRKTALGADSSAGQHEHAILR